MPDGRWCISARSARELRDHHGADVLVLGCAGMAQYRAELEAALDLPVVDPTQAAVTMAIGAVRLAEAEPVEAS